MANEKIREMKNLTESITLIDTAIRSLNALDTIGTPDHALLAFRDNRETIKQTVDALTARSFSLKSKQNDLVIFG